MLFIIGALLGAFICYFIISPKLKKHEQINNEIKETNQQLNNELIHLTSKKESIIQEISELENTAKSTINTIYSQAEEIASNEFEKTLDKMAKDCEQAQIEYKKEYLTVLNEAAAAMSAQMERCSKELNSLVTELNNQKSITNAAIEANKRAFESKNKIDFYKLVLSDEDIAEIHKLKEVLPYLRDKEPLNKVIWKVYYEKPYTDLIGRVIGKGLHTGIYKITNIENNMCYVGQAVDIATRFKQHIKRGLGAETPTKNKLYPAMEKYGVENFTFEVIEECDRTLLNNREDYWQDYFKAKEFGYSIK